MPKRSWDKFDEEASREGHARSQFRLLGAVPTIIGKRIGGAKSRYKATRVGNNRNIGMERERRLGFGA
jgi:hypothetical protein